MYIFFINYAHSQGSYSFIRRTQFLGAFCLRNTTEK